MSFAFAKGRISVFEVSGQNGPRIHYRAVVDCRRRREGSFAYYRLWNWIIVDLDIFVSSGRSRDSSLPRIDNAKGVWRPFNRGDLQCTREAGRERRVRPIAAGTDMPPLWTIMSNIGALNVVDATKRRLSSAPIYFRRFYNIFHMEIGKCVSAMYFRRSTHRFVTTVLREYKYYMNVCKIDP